MIIFIAFIVLLIGGYFVFISDKADEKMKKTAGAMTPEHVEQFAFYKNSQNSTKSNSAMTKYDSNVIASNSNVYQGDPKNTKTNLKSDISKLPLSALIKKDGSYQCTWNYQNQNNSQISGTSFISNSMALIELKGTINNTQNSTFFLTRNGYIYYWGTGMPGSGYKTKVLNQNLNSEKLGYSMSDDVIIKNPSYYCQLWNNPTLGTFTIPKLNFKEI